MDPTLWQAADFQHHRSTDRSVAPRPARCKVRSASESESVTPTIYVVGMAIRLENDQVHIDELVCEMPRLASLLRRTPPDERAEVVCQALEVGAVGLANTRLGLGLDEAEARFRAVATESAAALAAKFDPDIRGSMVAKAQTEFASVFEQLLASIDPSSTDSHAARFLALIEERLTTALDSEDSSMVQLRQAVEQGFLQVEKQMARNDGKNDGKAEEAAKGTSKGVAYEDLLEDTLRSQAKVIGALVERTSRDPGSLGPTALVGDFVLILASGKRIVLEAKNKASLGLHGDGVLKELDRAMANRRAEFAICCSAVDDAYPSEVGRFGVYDDKVLVVDDGDGTMLAAAIRWAAARIDAPVDDAGMIDAAAIAEKLDRIRALGQRVSATKRSLTEVRTSLEGAGNSLDELRSDLLDLVDEALRELRLVGDVAEAPLAVA